MSSRIEKSCTTCRHVKVCFLYRMAVNGIKAFDEEAEGILKFPMKPEVIAYNCPEYESPLDVVKRAKFTQEQHEKTEEKPSV